MQFSRFLTFAMITLPRGSLLKVIQHSKPKAEKSHHQSGFLLYNSKI